MEIFGADRIGVDGRLIKFSVIREQDRRGTTLLGLPQKVVKEGYQRALKAIETLTGDWNIQNQGYTIELEPAETPKFSSGLDLPLAIMLLQASIMQDLEKLETSIAKLRDESNSEAIKNKQEKRKRILERLDSLINQRDKILRYRERISKNKNKYLLIGKLNIISGKICSPLYGLIGMVSAAKKGFMVIVPEEDEVHAALIARARRDERIVAYKATDLQEVWDVIIGVKQPRLAQFSKERIQEKKTVKYIPDLKAIEGLSQAKLAMEVALAGGHNILLVGPAGQGKTMLAKAAINLLPDLTPEEIFEVNKIYSARGDLAENTLVLRRPYQEVANTTEAALFGGGQYSVPGLISAAHKGVLFIDEINTYSHQMIEQLRKPLSDRVYKVQRAASIFVEFPSNFILVAAMNPCHCGWYEHFYCPVCKDIYFGEDSTCRRHPEERLVPKCQCSDISIHSYKRALSKPLLDRIDLKVFVSPYDTLPTTQNLYTTRTIKQRIQRARNIQSQRYKKSASINCNADVPDKSQYELFDTLGGQMENFLQSTYKTHKVESKRTEVKLLLVARTLADLDASNSIKEEHVVQAGVLMGISHRYFREF